VFETFVVRLLAIVGVFFPGVNPDVSMSQPVVELRGERVAASCVLERPLSDDLVRVIDSGSEVTLVFACRLRYADGAPTRYADTTITHTVRKNLATEAYEIDLGNRTVLTSQITDYSIFFRLETVPLWPVQGLAEGGTYIVDISATMEPISIHATARNYDLMSLWNFKTPRNQSEHFSLVTLEQRRVDP
jgi:hypothetical protein